MKMLIVGAGVIGTVYGAHLAAAGNHISVLSHGRRTDEVAAGGLSARDVLGGGRQRTGPGNLEGEFAPNKQLGAARDVDGQCVCAVAASFREAFFFQLQAAVRLVKRHTELVRSRGKGVLEMHGLALLLRCQVRREE